MIDLHCHILPGIDDGPPDLDAGVAIARAAAEAGTRAIVATPHLNRRYFTEPEGIALRAWALSETLVQRRVALRVLAGAEVAHSALARLDDRSLRSLCLGGGDCLLLEAPYGAAPLFSEAVFELQAKGLRVLLAHPERCQAFRRAPQLLGGLVERGALCSVTAGSLSGRFGTRTRRFAERMLAEGLIHSVDSDAHDTAGRPPELGAPFSRSGRAGTELRRLAEWLTEAVPAALIAGEPLPPRPRAVGRWGRRGWRAGGPAR